MRISLILFSLLWSVNSFSQYSLWEPYMDVDGVKFETKTIECFDNEILTFKISNTNDYSVYISWNEEVWVDGVCKQTGDSDEDVRELILLPGEIEEGSCDFKESFYIGSKTSRGSRLMTLTHFDLLNVNVSKYIYFKEKE